MKAREYLSRLRDLPIDAPEAVHGGEPFLVLSPHPDDETLGAGGLLAAASDAGQHAEVLVVTDGAGSHPNSTLYPKPRLVALRAEETDRAVMALGLPAGRVHRLDLPDTAAPTEGPSFEAAVDAIRTHLHACRARTLLVTAATDPHCDHEAAFRMALTVRAREPGLRLMAYPIWTWALEADVPLDVPPPRGVRVDISAWRSRKAQAIDCYRTQMTPLIDDDPAGFHFTKPQLAPFLGELETFVEIEA